jgi:hypothetical protein
MSYSKNPARENKQGYLYTKGNEKDDGSIRLSINPFTLNTKIEERIDGIWQSASFEAGPDSVWVGPRVKIGGAGRHLIAEDSDGLIKFYSHSDFDGEVSTGRAKMVNAYNFIERDILLSDNSGEWTGDSFAFVYFAEDHAMIQKAYFQTGSLAALTPVRIQVWEGSDDTGPVVFDRYYYESLFANNIETEIFTVGILEFNEETNYYIKLSSDNNFSLKTSLDQSLPWLAIDVSLIKEEDMLQATPYKDGDTYIQGQWAIQNQKIYECNVTGIQTGTFADNSDKWDPLISDIDDFDSRVENNSEVLSNTSHRNGDGKSHSDVVLNNSHRVSDGKDHSDVILNNAKRSYPLADEAKLSGVESGAEVNQSDSEIKSQYENNADTNAFTDSEQTKLSNQSGTNTGDVTLDSGDTTQESFDLTNQKLKGILATAVNDGLLSKEDKEHIDNIVSNGLASGWDSGLATSENSPKDTSILYGAGTYVINGHNKAIASNGVYDLSNGYSSVNHYSGMIDDQHALVSIYVDNDEVIKSLRGDVGEKGEVIFPPLQPADSVCIAEVEIRVDGSGNPKDIDDKRIYDCRTSPSLNTDETVAASVNSTLTSYLIDILSNNGNVNFTLENPGGAETIKADVPIDGGLTSATYIGTSHIDGYDVSSIDVLYVDSTADIEIQSLQNGTDNKIFRIINLSLKKVKFMNDNGTYESLMVEGNADVICDRYGGGTFIYNASKGNWYFIGIN